MKNRHIIFGVAVVLALAGCANGSNPINSKIVDPLITALSRIGNTAQADLVQAQAVAKAATPPDTDGVNCAGAAITVLGQINQVNAAAGGPNAGVFTVAELASLFKPGSAQYNQANNTLATGCIAKINDVMGPQAVLLGGGVAGVLAASNGILPLAAAAP